MTFQTQNETLHQQLEDTQLQATTMDRKAVESFQSQLEYAREEVQELRVQLQLAERVKEDQAVAHNQEIAKLNRKIQESNTVSYMKNKSISSTCFVMKCLISYGMWNITAS